MVQKRPVLKQRLREFYSLAEMNRFLRTPQPLLEDRVPAEMILNGDGELIHQMLDRLESGVYL